MQQIIGHSRADIFERYYILQKVKQDVQSAYLGCPTRELLTCSVGRMTLTRDPQAPTKLTNAQKSELEQDPQLVALSQQKQALEDDIKF